MEKQKNPPCQFPVFPPKSGKALNFNDSELFYAPCRDRFGTEPNNETSLSDKNLYDLLQELSERKKMQFFKPIPLVDYRGCTLSQGKEWFICFYVKNPATGRLSRVRIKVNRIKSITARRKAARQMMAAIDMRLSLGWNPFLEAVAPKASVKLSEALDHFLTVKGKEMEGNSLRVYRSFIKIFQEWLDSNHFDPEGLVCSITRDAALSFLADIESSMSAKTYNNYVNFYRSLFAWMKSKGYTDENPFEGIQKKSRKLTKKNRRLLTDVELSSMISFLSRENETYLAMAMICYCCLIRPKEIVMLRCADIDLDKKVIHVRPEIAKNDNDSFRTISDELLPVLQRLDLSHPDWYVFAQHPDFDFSPGTEMMCSRKVAKYWDLKVRPACGFGMDVKFYSLKDTGITNMLESGVPINVVQQQADHSSVAMTAIYVGKKAEASETLKTVRILNGIEH